MLEKVVKKYDFWHIERQKGLHNSTKVLKVFWFI
jgi:hypothetical protein